MTRFVTLLFLATLVVACDNAQEAVTVPPQPDDTKTTPDPLEKEAEPSSDPKWATAAPKDPIAANEKATVELSVLPPAGFKVNKKFGWKFEFQADENFEIHTPKVAKDAIALEDAAAKIPVELTPKTAGEHTLVANASFSMCNDTKCELYVDERVEFTLAANTATP